MARCSTTEKVRHATRDGAISAAFRLLAKDNDAGHRPINVYRCAKCGDFHVGHRPKRLVSSRATTPPVVDNSPRCECACSRLARVEVMTPRGAVRCCDRHAKQLEAAYGAIA